MDVVRHDRERAKLDSESQLRLADQRTHYLRVSAQYRHTCFEHNVIEVPRTDRPHCLSSRIFFLFEERNLSRVVSDEQVRYQISRHARIQNALHACRFHFRVLKIQLTHCHARAVVSNAMEQQFKFVCRKIFFANSINEQEFAAATA